MTDSDIPEEILPSDPSTISTTFRITPLKPVAALREAALAARPPVEPGSYPEPDLVELRTLDPTFRYDIRYATADNFLGEAVYEAPHAFLQRPAAEALVRVQRELRKAGYGLVVYDAYRPWHVTKLFWEATPPSLRQFVADPARGSRHNLGAAVDVGLYDLATGALLAMPSGYDEFTERAHADYAGGSAEARANRDLLRRAMERQGYAVYEYEWWHFDHEGHGPYPILNLTFEELRAASGVAES